MEKFATIFWYVPKMIESACKTFMPIQTLVLHRVLPLGSQQLTAAKYMSLSRKTLAIDSMIFAERMQSASQGA